MIGTLVGNNMKYKTFTFEEAAKLNPENPEFTELLEYHDFDYRSVVCEIEGDKPIRILGMDGGEPEDQTLYRDWSWVASELNKAFEIGRNQVLESEIGT